MGFGLPAAIGAALAMPERRVVCFTGDGSILMNIQELATLAELNANVAIIVLNNGHLGLVRQQQELFYGERYVASRFESALDFSAIARGFGVRALNAREAANPTESIARELQAPGPALIDIPIRFNENVWPMVPAGAANRDMLGVSDGGLRLERS
jgi:acetolactate synthase-1/2/3 large subunit